MKMCNTFKRTAYICVLHLLICTASVLLGFVDHSARVMQVITWNRSFKGIPQPENVKNELDDDEWETHATVLDKLLAWEKKLYHEVKVNYVFLITRLSHYLLEACIFVMHLFFPSITKEGE
jgi:hypothetical protein